MILDSCSELILSFVRSINVRACWERSPAAAEDQVALRRVHTFRLRALLRSARRRYSRSARVRNELGAPRCAFLREDPTRRGGRRGEVIRIGTARRGRQPFPLVTPSESAPLVTMARVLPSWELRQRMLVRERSTRRKWKPFSLAYCLQWSHAFDSCRTCASNTAGGPDAARGPSHGGQMGRERFPRRKSERSSGV